MPVVKLSAKAEADIRKLDRPVAKRVLDALNRLREGDTRAVRRLQGAGNEHRMRVGDWRIRFEREGADVVRVLRVLHRSEAYRD